MRKIIVVGAGVAGAAAVSVLRSAGLTPIVLDKGRSIGGRLATRRSGTLIFDHGSPHFDLPINNFNELCGGARSGLAQWRPRVPPETDHRERWVGRIGMSDVLAPCFADTPVRLDQPVGAIAADGTQLQVRMLGSEFAEPADAVILTVPAPQAATLLTPLSSAFAACRQVDYAPVWTAMLAFSKSVAVPFDLVRSDEPVLDWAFRDNSRPGRADGADRWVLHARSEWTKANLEMDKSDAAQHLLSEFRRTLGKAALEAGEPILILGHRWRYARVERGALEPFVADTGKRIFAAGDWCGVGDIAGAWTSGTAAAQELLKGL